MVSVAGSLLASPALAATLYIDPPTVTLNRGDAVTLSVRLDTNESESECINAIDAVITYDEGVSPVDISVGESILPVWVEYPTINKETRQITLAGGIPNGYCGRVSGDPRLTNKIVELVFRAPGLSVGGGAETNSVTVSFAPETTAYLNDGFGTVANLTTLGATIALSKEVGSDIQDDWRDDISNDQEPPEEFSISLEHDEFAFNQQYYIVFNTTDKQTGLSHFEVLEEAPQEVSLFGFGAVTAPWQEARSPYVLKDQSLRSTVRVKALDKAGNEYIATLAPQNTSSALWPKYLPWLVVAVGGVLVLATVVWLLLRRRKRAKTVLPAADNMNLE